MFYLENYWGGVVHTGVVQGGLCGPSWVVQGVVRACGIGKQDLSREFAISLFFTAVCARTSHLMTPSTPYGTALPHLCFQWLGLTTHSFDFNECLKQKPEFQDRPCVPETRAKWLGSDERLK